MEYGFALTYSVQLLFDELPQMNKRDLLGQLRKYCGRVESVAPRKEFNLPSPAEEFDLMAFAYPDHRVTYAGGKSTPALTLITTSETQPDPQVLESALQQTWDWPEARTTVSKCCATMFVTDLMASGLEYKTRLALFHSVVLSVLELTPSLAIHWLPSQRVVDPQAYLNSKRTGTETYKPTFPAVNVRFFKAENRAPGEMLADTLGLAALGIPDLQCHFAGLDLSDVGNALYGYGCYLFEHGDIIANGDTVQGITEDQRWVCRHEKALVPPERVVIDVNPGAPYAVGKRH